MRIVAISDLHGHLPPDVPASDLVLIAGDVCPDARTPYTQAAWLRDTFTPWAEQLQTRAVAMCWGNHDFVGQLPANLLPPLPVELITDRTATVEGLTLYASPWTCTVPGVWAFDVERVQPRLHVFGHIHEARGREGSSYNVAIVDERYQPYELPLTVIDL